MAECSGWDGSVWWTRWLNMARQGGIASLSQFAKRLAAYVQGILASATCRLNTSVLEGISNRIEAIKRMA